MASHEDTKRHEHTKIFLYKRVSWSSWIFVIS